jgi:periplasmic protein TonB
MSSRRVALCCVMVALALAAALTAQDVQSTPGPLERRAKPITAENPVPRRTFSVAPAYPAEARAIDATAMVTMRITLDEGGRVAEIRPMNNPLVAVPPGTPSNPTALRSVADALIRSAAAALMQWTYDAPSAGPISFNAVFNFRPNADTTMTQITAGPRDGVIGGVVSGVVAPAGGVVPPGAVRVGGNIKAPQRTRMMNPVYPPIAMSARVQGVVILEAVIGPDGKVADARVLRSIPLLDQAAVDAVKQWEYTPTLLNGAPVPVIMTVTVQFTLPDPPPPPPPPPQ